MTSRPINTKIRLDRLQTLHDHCAIMLTEKNFDLTQVKKLFLNRKGNTCNTAGCLYGELPFADPIYWKYQISDLSDRYYSIFEVVYQDRNSIKEAARGISHHYRHEPGLMDYFGISVQECSHLFYLSSQRSQAPYFTTVLSRYDLKPALNNLQVFINYYQSLAAKTENTVLA